MLGVNELQDACSGVDDVMTLLTQISLKYVWSEVSNKPCKVNSALYTNVAFVLEGSGWLTSQSSLPGIFMTSSMTQAFNA